LEMKHLVCVFALLVLAIASSEKKTYENYQVHRFVLQGNETQRYDRIMAIHATADQYLLDVWSTNIALGWADVMIPPHLTASIDSLFPNCPHYISIQDVQESIDESERERAQYRSSKRALEQDEIFADFQEYGAIIQWLQVQASKHPSHERFSIGNSYEGTPIYGIHLGKTGNKPVIVIQCGIHAREWITPTHCLWIVDQLVNTDPQRGNLLAQYEFVIVPVLNVDGYDFSHTSNRLWRKNRQPAPGSTCIGTDLNRNYGFGWSGPGASPNPCTETYYGSAAYSGPETAASRNLVYRFVDAGTLVSFWDLHAYSALWMSAWGYTCNAVPADYAAMNRAMTAATTACRNVNGNSYAFGQICRTIYQASGSSVDFGYGDAGIAHSYTTEAYGSNFTPPPSWIVPIGSEIWAGLKASFAAMDTVSIMAQNAARK